MNYLNLLVPSLWFKVFVVLIGLRIVKYYWNHRRFFILGDKLPGPKPLPLVGNSLKVIFNNKKHRTGLLNSTNKLNQKYGLARLWIGHYLHVFVSSPEDAMIFYTSSKMLDRPEFFKFFEPILGNSLQAKNGSEWKEYRHNLEPVYQSKFLMKISCIFQQKTDILIHLLEKETNSTISINRLIVKCLADIAYETFSGVQSDIQEQNVPLCEEFEMIPILSIKRTLVFWQNIDWIFKWTAAGKRYFHAIETLNKSIQEHIEIHKKSFFEEIENFNNEMEKNPEIRIFFLRHHENKTDKDIKDYILSTVFPATDTSNTAISMALLMLAIHQDVQQKLYEEISSSAEKNFDDKELRKLDYLNRVIKETLRFLPPIPVSSRQAGDDIWFGRHLVPKGASVNINIYAIHRDPKQYENPDQFDPDHFLPEKVSKRHPYSYIPFGMGKRNCIGYNFALVAMRIFLAKIIFNYKIECDLKLEDVISRLRLYITLKMKNLHYPVRLIKR